jgi:hypothetical protein
MSTEKPETTQAEAEISEESLEQIAGGTGEPLGIDIDKAVAPSGERVIVITDPSYHGKQTLITFPKSS